MLEIGELWVNWTEGAEYAYQVYEPFEWKEEDPLECIRRVPALKVTPSFFDYLENGLNELPEQLFLDLKDERNPYCFIASDGLRSIVIDTLGYQTPMRKSRLRYDDERMILRYLRYEEVKTYNMESPTEHLALFALPPHTMRGLTRAEREKKQLLMEALYGLKEAKKAKIFYYYIEFDHTLYRQAKTLKKANLYTQFVQAVKTGWTAQHEHVLQVFLQENEELQLLYAVRV